MLAIATVLAATLLAGDTQAQGASGTVNASQWRRSAVDCALQSTASISDPYRRAELLAGIAKAQAREVGSDDVTRTLQAALAAAGEVQEPEFQGWVLQEIVVAQLAADDQIGARQTVVRIRSVRPQAAALAAIAIDQLRARKLVAAQATAAGIRDSATAGHVQRQIVLTQLGMNDLPAARKTAMDIDDKFSQGLALGDVAAAYVRMGDAVSANDVATRARKSQRSQIHARVAFARADAGDLNGALVSTDKIGDEAERGLVYARLGALRAAAGNRQQARQLFADAMALLEKAKAPRNQAITWAQLARVAILADEPATAREAMSNAMEAVVQMPVGPPRDEALDLVARNQARMGDGMAALGTSRQVSDRVARALLTRDVVASQSSLSAAEELARQPEVLNDALIRAAALFGVIEVQLLRKGPTRSEPQAIGATIDAARDAVRSVEDVQIRPGALTALAAARLTAGDAVAGSDLFAEALESAALPGGPGQRATACLRMVKALDGRLIFLGQPATADDPRGQPETAPR